MHLLLFTIFMAFLVASAFGEQVSNGLQTVAASELKAQYIGRV